MVALPLVFLSWCSWMFALASGDIQHVTAKPGENVTLHCQAPGHGYGYQYLAHPYSSITWERPDLGPENYVFFSQSNRSVEQHQLPSYRGRVELRDPELKNGDTSVVLKNVRVNDSGTYECGVIDGTLACILGEIPPDSIIKLMVIDSGEGGGDKAGRIMNGRITGQHVWLITGLSVGVLLAVVVVVAIVCWMTRRKYTVLTEIHSY
ncbi:butyrophilin subfamily 2 member A1-like [Plectropomus leopardus]|uniref:butyrophilin subfamily 2 member A1-like n=1 Tax=Plectropomus leopardus TaxID=160734 RepID=UPI001C4D53B0|nr:butyrophilin subfamily 2 member A1-like [Plectropomus leopardus]